MTEEFDDKIVAEGFRDAINDHLNIKRNTYELTKEEEGYMSSLDRKERDIWFERYSQSDSWLQGRRLFWAMCKDSSRLIKLIGS